MGEQGDVCSKDGTDQVDGRFVEFAVVGNHLGSNSGDVGIGMGTLTASADLLNLTGLSRFGFVIGVVLHLIARRALNGLEA